MACGIHLGIFLICLVQAEHVRCLWASQAQSSKRQNGNAYVGFPQQDSGLRLGGSYLQNQFRQASTDPDSAQSSSFNMQAGYSQGPSSRDYTQGVSQPAQNSYFSVKAGKSSLLSNPNWKTSSLAQLNAQKVPKREFGLSTYIVSGTTLNSSHKKQNSPINSRTWPVQQGTQRTSQYLSSSSASVKSPRESFSFKPASSQMAAQKPSSTANAPAYYWQKQAPKDFSPRAPDQQRKIVKMQTSASAPARRVSSLRSAKAPKKPFNFSTSNEGPRYSPSQSGAGNPSLSIYQQKGSPNSRAGTSGQRFAPTKTHNIPERFGGFAIRRLGDTDQKVQNTWKPQQTYMAPTQQTYMAPTQQTYAARPQQTYAALPQQTYMAPTQQTVSYKPPVQSAHKPSKWLRVRPQHAGAERLIS
ncbi:uncharacterized protein LOC121912395 [Scomber scombrus]|uniref:Uncharacterized protein LOC121912395 n=1 Tax=Scomber scombrus TaxID=13677 RepID=A0AAV1NNB6_SCOSC